MEGAQQITESIWDTLELADRSATLWINSFHNPSSDAFWTFMSEIKVWIPLYVAIAALMIWRLGWKKGLIAIVCIALAFFFNERVCNFIKEMAQRVRPCNDEAMIAAGINAIGIGGGYSFPSGHACNCFGLATSSILSIKADSRHHWYTYSAFIIVWAVLIGISRIMMARHFLGDVLVGAAIGAFMGVIWGCLSQFLCARLKIVQ